MDQDTLILVIQVAGLALCLRVILEFVWLAIEDIYDAGKRDDD